ncbi:hypothetical protein [Neobacillus mesonae]|uniref:hypothetical protein n=1 Tax=Neobacillus mesonae TaxID=1193713 RepID=UPI00203FED9D|nr:hypothetical protein [Neobacillus mesonae]MCM3568570.1 hypothetical protein [Neobacillus mesonae]
MNEKNIRPIRGKQVSPSAPPLHPNPIRPECIRVTKVYDWVVLTNRDRNKVPIPEACFAEIEACRLAGNTVTATCEEVPDTRTCDVVGARPANIPGVTGAKIVTLSFLVNIRIQFLCNGTPLPGCDFVVPVSFMDDVILCYPDGTVINCNIFDVSCTVVLNQMLGNMVVIDVVMCKDIQVEADVKLEVEAKFCGPRPIVPIPEEEVVCPPITFPEQCPSFFPEANCLCQGAADFTGFTATGVSVTQDGSGGGIVPGQLDFAALVCDQCDRSNSSLVVRFIEEATGTATPAPGNEIDRSFTFRALQFNQPTCPAGTLMVTGTGILTIDGGVPENADFTLTITATTATLTILGGLDVVTVTLSPATTPGVITEVGPCGRF